MAVFWVFSTITVLGGGIHIQATLTIPMQANRKQNGVKLTTSKIGSRVMVRVVTKYGT